MSLDIKDFYYLLNAKLLLSHLREVLECSLMLFQSVSGTVMDDLLKLVELYLSATVVRVNDALFIQKEGICISSWTHVS